MPCGIAGLAVGGEEGRRLKALGQRRPALLTAGLICSLIGVTAAAMAFFLSISGIAAGTSKPY